VVTTPALAALDAAGLADVTRVIYTSDHGDNLGARGLWGKSTMYEEAVAVPLLLAGPGLPIGVRATTPVSLLDLYPFIMASVGTLSPETVTPTHPGRCVTEVLATPQPHRAVFSEYHGMGSKTAAYMLRKGRYKLVHYADYEPQLFDLASDPEELTDLARRVDAKPVLDDLQTELHRICDPDEVNRRAKHDQQRLLAKVGGKDFVIKRGDLGFSPPPGVPAQFSSGGNS
jgi:choline-sulfatase